MDTSQLDVSNQPDLLEINGQFYNSLWAAARLIEPQRFNTWPLVCSVVSDDQLRLEVAPGLRPRLPLAGTHFVDQSGPAVEKLRASGANALTGLASDLPFPDSTFELICAFDIVEHVDDDDGVLSELARVATPHATLLLSVPLHPEHWTAFDVIVGHRRRYEPQRLLAKLAAHGFSIERSAVYGMRPKSSRLTDVGMWFLTHHRRWAMWWYNRVFMPLGIHFQKELAFVDGLIDSESVDEVLLVCRKLVGPQAGL